VRRVPWLQGAALAKVTLSLRVTGVRPDGYHDLEALTVSSAGPADFVHLNRRRRAGVRVAVQPRGSAPTSADNLAVRAAELVLAEIAGWRGGLHVRLRKQIPVGAGLGGGSSDAAAVLRLLGHVGNVPELRLLELAAQLGSDVPFCLHGTPAWMRGRGERLEPIAGLPALMLVIAVPSFGCATNAVYRAWDELGGPRSARTIAAPPPYAHLVDTFANDLEPAAEHVEPRLVAFREQFEQLVERSALLCGSGSAYAAWFDDADEWQLAHEAARRGLARSYVFAGATIGG
jgi:4-diphosphocytidyl-2-C-methyl-D-erythritol kinase